MRRLRSGITYLEVAVAFGIFMLLSFGTFAMLLHTGRNFVFVREHTVGMHGARSMMYEVRNAVADGGVGAAEAAIAAAFARLEPMEYVLLIYNAHSGLLVASYASAYASTIAPVFDSIFPESERNAYVVIVLVFGSGGAVVGRAYGVAFWQ